MKNHKHGGRVFEAAENLGKPWREIIDFSANINPLGQPKGLKAALFRDFDKSLHYPEPKAESLARFIAEGAGLPPEMAMPGSGSSPQLYLLCRVLDFARPIIIGPAFAEYEMALNAAGRKPEYVLAREADDWLVTAKTVAKAFDKNPDAIFLANPANPTSRLVPEETMAELIEEAGRRKIHTVVDEAFIDFAGGRSALPYLVKNPRLIVLRSLTKIFALPGLRLAWLAAAPALIEKFRAQTEPWPLSSLAIDAGHFCLAQEGWVERSRAALPKLRANLAKGLSPWGRVYPSESNYILIKLAREHDPDVFLNFLNERGILLRDASNFKGLEKGHLRLALRPIAEQAALFAALKDFSKR